MKLTFVFLISLLILSCSFDNKTGIWNNNSIISKNDSKSNLQYNSPNDYLFNNNENNSNLNSANLNNETFL